MIFKHQSSDFALTEVKDLTVENDQMADKCFETIFRWSKHLYAIKLSDVNYTLNRSNEPMPFMRCPRMEVKAIEKRAS